MAENISDKDVVLTPPVRVSEPFALPPSLDVELFKDRSLQTSDLPTQGNGITIPDSGEVIIIEPGDGKLLPPGGAKVVQQIVRFGPDGRQIVDVVIEAEPAEGATDYDIRRANV